MALTEDSIVDSIDVLLDGQIQVGMICLWKTLE